MPRKKKSVTREGTWDELRIHPGKFPKMCAEGKATKVGKDKHGVTIWRVTEEWP